MKRRSRKSRQRFGSSLRQPLGLLNIGKQQKRKQWTFEKLEDRLVFSVAPMQLQTVSFGNNTPEGAAMTWLAEQEWNAVQAAAAAGLPAPDYVLLSLPNDPLFQDQWNLVNTGQEVGNPDLQHLFGVAGEDINVVPAWNMGVTGAGVTVAVIDSGVQIGHPDLIANISPTLRYNAETGTSSVSPDVFFDQEAGHGTSVAGIIGATDNNGIGISGIAPDVTIVPIKLDFTINQNPNVDQIANAFQYALQHGVDVTNNSYGPSHATTRSIAPLTDAEAQVLRDAAIFGRNGLGMINVFASGNNGGPSFNVGFDNNIGNYSSSSYNGFANSRYVITVGGVDHDGEYINADGTFTSYPEIGPNVLVVAPTGSNGTISVANDNGYGSGIWTTDLTGDQGFNAAALPNGFDNDNDPLPDPNYTSRFNGTSAAAPEVTAVVALMLQANPDLTYRDVQEILVRSARQNAEFETPSSGALTGPRTTWQVNQIGPFRDPDPWNDGQLYPQPVIGNPFEAILNPLADPGLENAGGGFLAVDSNDGDRQGNSRYESEPPQYTNGAGYTVSQGYGVYSEQVGYAHGVVDAGLAVAMAKQWTTLGQNIAPNTEKTYTTSVADFGTGGLNLPAAEKTSDDNGDIVVPGGIGGRAGFIAYWNEFFKPVTITNGVPDPTTGPFSEDVPPSDTRGLSYIDFNVPPPQEIDVEWVEIKIDIAGPTNALNYLRIMLASPEGTQSDFNEYWADPGISSPQQYQPISTPGDAGTDQWSVAPAGSLNDAGGEFVWTFSTNRSWGETTNAAVVMDPVTGEPILGADGQPIFRNWELHLENWATASLSLKAVEVVWHGKPIDGGSLDPNYASEGIANAQRIQGFVGIDTNGDNQFNYGRYVQTVGDSDGDPSTTRLIDVTRNLDFNDNNQNGVYDSGDTINQEPFASNVVVDAYRVWDGVAESTPVARFLTGADGNYYFDLDVQGDLAQTGFGKAHAGQTLTYQIRATDPLGRAELEDIDTPAEATSNAAYTYLPHYKQVWTITPDWFYAPDRDNPIVSGNNPGEIFYDPTTGAPVPFTADGAIQRVPMAVKNINFLLKQDAPANNFDVNGTVYSDVNGNGVFDGTDAPASGVFVYWDKNRNGAFDQGETEVVTDANGQYVLNIDLTTLPTTPTTNSTYQIGVIKPTSEWKFTDPGKDGVETVFAGPGSPAQAVNFFLQPPSDPFPNGGVGLGSIQGLVFNDLNQNGVQDPGEPGVANFRVFIDTNHDGVYQNTETSTLTSSLGTYFFANVQPGVIRLDVVIPNEFTDSAAWSLTTPSFGYREVAVGAGGALTNVFFGLDNRADKDWGDLPDSYQTTAAAGGPSHVVVPGFQLGPSIDGEVNGVPTPLATGEGQVGDDDDGVHIVSNGGVLMKGTNTLNVMVEGVGGLLTGWMDFNGDGHFDESERLQWSLNGTSLGGEADINPGTYNLQITIPASAINGPIAARFRWGEQGLSFAGPAAIGEVEDYFFGLNYIYGDYDRNGVVNQADYNVWRHQLGTTVTPFSGADGNGDGVVNNADYDVWRAHFGQSLPSPGAGSLLAEGSGSGGTLAASGSGTGLGSGVATGGAFSSLSSVSTVSSILQPATMASGASNSSLLLMDLALGDIDSASFHTSDDSLYSDSTHTEDHPSDLALASVLSDDANWWNVN